MTTIEQSYRPPPEGGDDLRDSGSLFRPDKRVRTSVEWIQCAAVAGDLFLIAAATVFFDWSYDRIVAPTNQTTLDSLWLGLITALLFSVLFLVRGGYRGENLLDVRRQMLFACQAWTLAFFALGWAAFLTKATGSFSRGSILLSYVGLGMLTVALHGLGAMLLKRYLAARRISLHRVYVVALADGEAREAIAARLARQGIEIVGLFAIARGDLARARFGTMCRSMAEAVRQSLAAKPIEAIYLFLPWNEQRYIDEVRAVLSPLPIPIHLFPDGDVERILSRPQHRLGEVTGFEIQRAPLSRADRVLKRALDIVVAGGALIVMSPILMMVALAILLQRDGPILFRQDRKGFGGRPFTILKFRTMRVQENGADVRQAERNDSRVTRLGAVLRRMSIDELPQLFNVLKGDMSIVGPRPHAIAHDNLYGRIIARYAFRHHVKPGITGWAQVNGCRGETREVRQMETRIEYDMWYINNWSPFLDIRILVKTAIQVFTDKQAY